MASALKPPLPRHFNILYFATASSFTGKEHEALPAPLPLSGLFAELESRYPGIRDGILGSCLVTVNLDYVDAGDGEGAAEVVIEEGDEVAIIPPVSSGPGSSASRSPPPSPSFSLAEPPLHLEAQPSPSYRPSFTTLLQRTTPKTTSPTSPTTASVESIVTTDVKLVIVETLHPSGLVLISHLSAQWGHIPSSYAGASSGILYLFGTQDHV
ncbi:Molybdopterin synthase sulfur carrier subunit [Cladobotryum mycophilum]|uniref:Molybdopterin synthase sulfur carrier subunit n=1 Tax=Cladobotryum mycophilum TaxID=491253 RepID=A0ABR0S5Y8_9HYPO